MTCSVSFSRFCSQLPRTNPPLLSPSPPPIPGWVVRGTERWQICWVLTDDFMPSDNELPSDADLTGCTETRCTNVALTLPPGWGGISCGRPHAATYVFSQSGYTWQKSVKERKEGENERRRETWGGGRESDGQTDRDRKIGRQRKTKRMRKWVSLWMYMCVCVFNVCVRQQRVCVEK